MRYDIFIIDDEITFNNFNEVAQNSIKNAKVTFFSEKEDLINEMKSRMQKSVYSSRRNKNKERNL